MQREKWRTKRNGKTHPQKLRIGQHALFQARRQEINMVLHQFIHSPFDLSGRCKAILTFSACRSTRIRSIVSIALSQPLHQVQ
jgi:hypothetical protein